MHVEHFFDLLTQAFDAGRCMERLCAIWSNDRHFRYTSFAKTAAYVEAEMRSMGLAGVERLPLMADGRTAYGDWVIPRAWDVERAILRSADDPSDVLCDYGTTPCSLLMYSAPTPGVVAEVVVVDDPDSSATVPIKGKLILTNQPARALVPPALEEGALGILSDHMPLYPGVRENIDEMAGISRWDNDFILPRNDTRLFGFSLSPDCGARLRARIAGSDAPVHLYAQVDARFYDGTCDTVSGAIPGTDPDAGEMLFYGHLYEPGALDNASGCAVLLELAHCLTRAIENGQLARPRQTLRFALGCECAGSTGYLLAHPDRRAKTHFCAVADMVGTEAIDRAELGLWHNPLSNWSVVDAVMPELIRRHRRHTGALYPWRECPFSVGTDNVIGDPCWGVPTVAMITSPAMSYHSSLDVPERIDPAILLRSGVLLGALALYLGNLDRGETEVLGVHCDAVISMLKAQRAPHPASEYVWTLARHRCRAQLAALAGLPAHLETPPPLPAGPHGQRPERRVPGCLTFWARPELRDAQWQPAWNDRLTLPLFWADGHRTLHEIALLSGYEAGESAAALDGRLEWLGTYFEFLTRWGYITNNRGGDHHAKSTSNKDL